MLATTVTKDHSLRAKHSIKVLCLQSHRDLLRALGVQNGSGWLCRCPLIRVWLGALFLCPLQIFYLSLLTSWCLISFNPLNLALTHMVSHSDLPFHLPTPWSMNKTNSSPELQSLPLLTCPFQSFLYASCSFLFQDMTSFLCQWHFIRQLLNI